MRLSMRLNKYRKATSWFLALIFVVFGARVFAQSAGLYTAVPPSVAETASPLVMLVMSRDHQLWYEAYTNYADMNGDGTLDTTYVDSVDYYGYFNSNFCYDYTSAGIFEPNGRVDSPTHQCNGGGSGQWSGNFLNWLTTTRIDVVRKVLYGGYRYIDDPNRTVLQRAFLPNDNHSFAKTVRNVDLDGATIADFTPINGEAELSFCNVTEWDSGAERMSGLMDAGSNPPKFKVARGIYRAWAGNEAVQCGWNSGLSPGRPSPDINGIPTSDELLVRVEVCVDGEDALDADSCRRYVDAGGAESFKPYGLLQRYGESGEYSFGLITGSYGKKEAGGVLRKNVVYMGGSEAADADREIDSETGQFINQANSDFGIIKTIDRLRIRGWRYGGGARYDDCRGLVDIPEFLAADAADEQCRDWGNPISETYLEALRYFTHLNSGTGSPLSPTTAFFADDSTLLPGLQTATWQDPFTEEAACSNCSIVVLSTGLNDFDGDQLGSGSDLPGLSGANPFSGWTDDVGEHEGLDVAGTTYLVGSNSGGSATEPRCTAKSLSGGLSTAAGFCPETPALQGTFNIAGAAYYAHETDLRPDLEGKQNVKTYTVSLAESMPSFEVQAGTESLTFVPTCKAHPAANAHPTDYDEWHPCTLVDLVVDDKHGPGDPITPHYGRMLVVWEDSPFGNDNDSDAYVVIEYCTATENVEINCPGYASLESTEFGDSAPANGYNYAVHNDKPAWLAVPDGNDTPFQIRLSLVGMSAGFALKFGYIIGGSVGADNHYEDEIVSYGPRFVESRYIDPLEADPTAPVWSADTRLFAAAAGTPFELKNPLWYAAKYGNFEELGGDIPVGIPNQAAEWDTDGDGNPDAYFPVKNPSRLRQALEQIFSDISEGVSAGSAVSVNAISGTGEGALYQAIFQPQLTAAAGDTANSVQWVGEIHSLFIDSKGRLREDNSGDPAGVGQLDAGDRVLEMRFDEDLGETVVDAFTIDSDTVTSDNPAGDKDSTVPAATFALSSDQFSPVWSATDNLHGLDQATIHLNRSSYSSSAELGRFIITSVDRDGDGQVIPIGANASSSDGLATDDAVDGAYNFEIDTFTTTPGSGTFSTDSFHHYFGRGTGVSAVEIENLINFIRGREGITGMRSRTLIDAANPSGKRHLLGDIVHSSPASVGGPADRYDLLYGDDSYRDFFKRYKNRRHVVYAGANDGMLHAFNGGFFDSSGPAFNVSNEDGTAVAHPLGSELWSYVPFNLLPHLQWLSSPDYSHVYYVDGPVQAFDVNIFDDTGDTDPETGTYPNGWGTIIVAGMRLGGGDFPVDHDDDPASPDRITRSAYVVLDVTDPERPPRLLAEITHPDLGFTTVAPTLVKRRLPDSNGDFTAGSEDDWYLVFASGPAAGGAVDLRTALSRGVSGKNSSIFVFDLYDKQPVSPVDPSAPIGPANPEIAVTQVEVFDDAGAPEGETFVGGLTAVDWNRDYQDDALYFGLVGGTPALPEGKLKRAGVSGYGSGSSGLTLSFSDFLLGSTANLSSNRPFSAAPLTYRSTSGERWVYAGTGRFLVDDDQLSSQQQYFFGIKEPEDGSNDVQVVDLFDTTGIDTFANGKLRNNGSAFDLNGDGQDDVFSDIVDYVADEQGWAFELRHPYLNNSLTYPHNRIRVFSKAALAGSNVVFTAFEGAGEYCDAEGVGYLFGPHFSAGIAAPFAAIAIDNDTTIPAEANEDEDVLTAGGEVPRVLIGDTQGNDVPSAPEVIPSGEGPCKSVVTQSGSAEVSVSDIKCKPFPAGRRGWREIPVN